MSLGISGVDLARSICHRRYYNPGGLSNAPGVVIEHTCGGGEAYLNGRLPQGLWYARTTVVLNMLLQCLLQFVRKIVAVVVMRFTQSLSVAQFKKNSASIGLLPFIHRYRHSIVTVQKGSAPS